MENIQNFSCATIHNPKICERHFLLQGMSILIWRTEVRTFARLLIYCYTINLTPLKINNHALFNYSVCFPFCALCLLFGLQTKPMKQNYFQPVQFYLQILLQFAEKNKNQNKTKVYLQSEFSRNVRFHETSKLLHTKSSCRNNPYCRLRFKAFQRVSRRSVQYHTIDPLMCDFSCICDQLSKGPKYIPIVNA